MPQAARYMELNSNSQEYSSRDGGSYFLHIVGMQPWARRLKEAFDRSEMKDMRELARKSDVDYGKLAKYFQGGVAQPRGDAVAKLAKALGVTEEWLRSGRGAQAAANSNLSTDTVEIAVFDLKLSAGPGSWSEDEPEPLRFKQVHLEWLRSFTRTPGDRLAFAFAAGDSMYPTINDGDEMLIDMLQRSPSREAIYALRSGDAVMVKRIAPDPRRPGHLFISSDNPTGKSWEAEQGEISVIGRVIWRGQPL